MRVQLKRFYCTVNVHCGYFTCPKVPIPIKSALGQARYIFEVDSTYIIEC